MRRFPHFIAFVLTLFFSADLSAQTEIGARAGVALTDVVVKGINLDVDVLDPGMKAGFTAGIYSNTPIGHNGFFFSPEINYIEKGFRIAQSVNPSIFGLEVPIRAEVLFTFGYVELPLLIKYKTGSGPVAAYVKAGPTLGYAVSGKMIVRAKTIVDFKIAETNLNTTKDNMYRAVEAGVMAGAGIGFDTGKKGHFHLDVSFMHGLTDVLDKPVLDVRVRNIGVGITAGYTMKF